MHRLKRIGARFWFLLSGMVKHFFKDDCYNKASALTYYTILAIVPTLALFLGIAKGFGIDQYLEKEIQESFSQQKDIFQYALEFAQQTLKTVQGGVIAGFGIIILVYTAISLMEYIEWAFNDIWKIRPERGWIKKYIEYIAAIIICPLFIIVSSSLTIYARSEVQSVAVLHYLLPLLSFLPWLFSWIVFYFLYSLIPDSTAKHWTKIVGAVFAGSLFQLWQIFYFYLQSKVFNYNAIYGAFAIIPLFLIWLQYSWVIALLGAELSARLEIDIFPHTRYTQKINTRQLGLLIVYHCLERFYQLGKPIGDAEMSEDLGVPLNYVEKMIDILLRAKILKKEKTGRKKIGYQPSPQANLYTIKDVLDAIDNDALSELYVDPSKALTKVCTKLDTLHAVLEESPTNVRLSELV